MKAVRTNLKAVNTNLKAVLPNLKGGIVNLKAVITNLKAVLPNLKGGIHDMKTGIINLNAVTINLKARNTNLKPHILNLKGHILYLKTSSTNLKPDILYTISCLLYSNSSIPLLLINLHQLLKVAHFLLQICNFLFTFRKLLLKFPGFLFRSTRFNRSGAVTIQRKKVMFQCNAYLHQQVALHRFPAQQARYAALAHVQESAQVAGPQVQFAHAFLNVFTDVYILVFHDIRKFSSSLFPFRKAVNSLLSNVNSYTKNGNLYLKDGLSHRKKGDSYRKGGNLFSKDGISHRKDVSSYLTNVISLRSAHKGSRSKGTSRIRAVNSFRRAVNTFLSTGRRHPNACIPHLPAVKHYISNLNTHYAN